VSGAQELSVKKTKVLCVDDEPQVLQGLALHLDQKFEVVSATSGVQGLELVASAGPFAVVLSDMRMPGMDGASFLGKVREAAPDTVRMLLTGHADMNAAIAAVNHGQIFRFLIKPCPPDQLRMAFDAAEEQYRLITAERVLLEETLHGSIKTLVDILSITNPVAFGRAGRARQLVRELAEALGLPDRWQLEVAAMLSQLGSVTLPDDTARKYFAGEALTREERAMVERLPDVTERLLANIPRLEPVREILALQAGRRVSGGASEARAMAANALKLALDFDEIESRGVALQEALDTLRGRTGAYLPQVLEDLFTCKGVGAVRQELREVSLRGLSVGMVLAEDLKTRTGLLLVARGFEITPSFIERARNFGDGYVREPVRVLVRVSRK
jgi:CheY-like chemotaxis protein